MYDRYSKLFRYLQLALDIVVLNAAFLLAGVIRFDDLRVENQEYYNYYVQLFVFMNFAWVLVAAMLNSHAFNPGQEIRKSVGKLINTLVLHLLVLALLLISLKGYYYSRLFFTYFYVAFVPLVVLGRIFLINALRKYLSKEHIARPVLLLGDEPSALTFKEELSLHPEFGLRIVGWFADENLHANGPLSAAKEWIKNNEVKEVFCALPPNHEDVLAWQLLAEQNLLRFRILPNLGVKSMANAQLEMFGEVPVLLLRKEPLEFRHNRLTKRLFDVCFSLFAIVFIFPWLFPLLMIGIKLTSKGPIFFKQERSGLNNQVFFVYKFRSMVVNAQAHQKQATKEDERITRFGHFLRKHNLDELPQFFNVLFNQMSVVGPRPHMLEHTKDYRKLINEFMVRHLIKPGITGLAQSRGLRGETSNPEDMRSRVKADVYYLENWSLLLDVKIIAETLWNMISGRRTGV